MKALIKRKPQTAAWYKGLELTDKPTPQSSSERGVKVRVVYAGICGTDVGIYQGKGSLAESMSRLSVPEVIIGHEFCGRIVELHDTARKPVAELLLKHKAISPKVKEFLYSRTLEQLTADKQLVSFLEENFYVTAEMHITCGICKQCRSQEEHMCKNTVGKGMHEDGIFAEYAVLPVNRLVLIEVGEIPPQIIGFMDALGNAVHTAQSAPISGRNVLITGAGVQGLMACAVAKAMGADKIFVTDVTPSTPEAVDKLSLAKNLGAMAFDVGSAAGQKALTRAVAEATDSTGVDVVFEMSGNYTAYVQALANVRMGGIILLLGLPTGKMEIDFAKEVVFKGLTIKGIYGRRIFDTWQLMRKLLAEGLISTLLSSGIITHELPLEFFEQGFSALNQGKAIKVLLKP